MNNGQSISKRFFVKAFNYLLIREELVAKRDGLL